MSTDTPEVRNIPLHYIEVKKDKDSSAANGEFRERLDFMLPWNGKRSRIFRMKLSPADIQYLRERLDQAEENIRKRFEDSWK